MSGITEDTLRRVVEEVVNKANDKLLEEVRSLTQEVSKIKAKTDNLEKRIDGVEADVVREMAAVREELKEQQQRVIRMSNLVLMGVPESGEGLKLAVKLMGVIYPTWTGPLIDNRIGVPNKKGPRPLRIPLPSASERAKALRECVKLKDHREFDKISVRRDLTKIQQQEIQLRSPVGTRSAKKRKPQQTGEDNSIKKHMTGIDDMDLGSTQ